MADDHQPDDPYLNCDQVAKVINADSVKGSTVRGWHKEGRMPRPDSRVGNLILWRRSTILAWLRLGCPVLTYPDAPGRHPKGDKSVE